MPSPGWVARERGRLEYDQVGYGGLPAALSSAPASRYIARRLEPQSCGCGTRIAAADLGKRLGGLNLAGFGYRPCCDPLGQQVGRKRDWVTCPDNLNGAQGATIQCELTDAGQTYGVNVSGTRVDASNVKFDIKADDQSKP